MFSRKMVGWRAACAWLALLALVPTPAEAGDLSIRNDLRIPVIVQTSVVSTSGVRRGRPVLVAPSKCAVDTITTPGNVQIVVFDAHVPTRMLARATIPCSGKSIGLCLVGSSGTPQASGQIARAGIQIVPVARVAASSR